MQRPGPLPAELRPWADVDAILVGGAATTPTLLARARDLMAEGTAVLVTALVVGFAISFFQSITQIQEVTLSFVPKTIAVSTDASSVRSYRASSTSLARLTTRM